MQALTSPAGLMELKVKKFYHPPNNVFLLIKLVSKIETPYKLESDFLTMSPPLIKKVDLKAFYTVAHFIFF